ncbi:MAG: hypothetical protein BWY24_00152 [Microgenomates group bacterium ADurb.Bin219]|nr:MAG: hypothetical protein BWY24_00152 [Microgenomates group bacterium ADurb.Bin219]HNP89607.1 hypothetical protein [Candidatus Woesebacteria bacterium]
MLKDLIISKVRVKLLEIFFARPNEIYHVRDLVRKTEEEINAVRRELAHMEQAGMVKKEPRGNRLYYWFNKNYLFYPELASIMAKTTGLGNEILKNKNKIGRLNFVMFSGKFVGKAERKPNEVDILVVGEVVIPELAALIKAEESRTQKEINYTVMTQEEFLFRKRRRDPFLMDVLGGSRVMIYGEESDLVS